MDGDLDLFLLNHSVHRNGAFAARKQISSALMTSFRATGSFGMMARLLLMSLNKPVSTAHLSVMD
jgi:hypothetical protein